MAAAGRLVLPQDGEELSVDEQQTLVAGLIEAYTHASSPERTEMLCVLPHRHQVPVMMDFDDHVASLLLSDALINSRVDPYVMLGVLLTRTDAPDSPVFDALEQCAEPRVQVIGRLIQDRLASMTPTLGTVGPGVEPMNPSRDRIGF
ncbi:MAG: hypothetical protein ACWA5W_07960 [Phycisphaerales bacterium]